MQYFQDPVAAGTTNFLVNTTGWFASDFGVELAVGLHEVSHILIPVVLLDQVVPLRQPLK